MALGYISAFAETLALAVIVSKGVPPLKDALISEPEDHIKAAAAWSLGQLGSHSPDHARALAEADVLRHLLAVMMHEDSSEGALLRYKQQRHAPHLFPCCAPDLKTKSKRALKAVVQQTTHLPSLEPLLKEAPVNILKHVLIQFKKCLPNDVQARRNFVQSGGLQIVQELNESVGGKLSEIIEDINKCYPAEIVQYYSPGYSKTLMSKIDEFAPSA